MPGYKEAIQNLEETKQQFYSSFVNALASCEMMRSILQSGLASRKGQCSAPKDGSKIWSAASAVVLYDRFFQTTA
jgi:hypothetical protein